MNYLIMLVGSLVFIFGLYLEIHVITGLTADRVVELSKPALVEIAKSHANEIKELASFKQGYEYWREYGEKAMSDNHTLKSLNEIYYKRIQELEGKLSG